MAPHSTPLWALGSGLLAGFCLCLGLYSGFFLSFVVCFFELKQHRLSLFQVLKGNHMKLHLNHFFVCVSVALVQVSAVQVKRNFISQTQTNNVLSSAFQH